MVTTGVCLVPTFFKTLKDIGRQAKKKLQLRVNWIVIFDGLAIILQISALTIWPLVSSQPAATYTWAFMTGLVMTSFGWWETFVDEHSIDPVSKLVMSNTNLEKQAKVLKLNASTTTRLTS